MRNVCNLYPYIFYTTTDKMYIKFDEKIIALTSRESPYIVKNRLYQKTRYQSLWVGPKIYLLEDSLYHVYNITDRFHNGREEIIPDKLFVYTSTQICVLIFISGWNQRNDLKSDIIMYRKGFNNHIFLVWTLHGAICV